MDSPAVGQEGAFNMFNDKGQIYYIVVDPDDLENIDTTLAFESLEEAKEFIAGESTTFDGCLILKAEKIATIKTGVSFLDDNKKEIL